MATFGETFWGDCGSSGWQTNSLRENVSPNERLISMVAGVAVATQVLRRGSFGTLLGSLLAAGLIYRSVTGHCKMKEAWERAGLSSLYPGGQPTDWRTAHRDIDMESDQSFPASDPPSWSGVTS